MMMKLQTPVADEKCKVGISFRDRILMLGSCFSDNIGRQLADFGFDVCVNPFGTLYNPVSILQSLELLSSDRMFTLEDCVPMGAGSSLTCSFRHHTSFARASAQEFVSDANVSLERARDHFRSCTRIIVTLGTSWCFRHIATDMVVSNCLKRPVAEFSRERLSPDQVRDAVRQLMFLAPGREFIFTVSPIRHFKDGAHGNQLSKSSLLCGVDMAIEGCQHADYFPAYEIMMDQLRDYRFYAEDMCHPSSQAVDYIRERFLDWALPEDEHPVLNENIRAFRRGCHIPKH